MSHPKKLEAFRQWAKLMELQAVVPDRVQYKGTSGRTSSLTTPRNGRGGPRRKKRRRRKRAKKAQD